MFFLKELTVLSAILILASLGLIEISNPYWNYTAQNQTETNSPLISSADNDENEFSNEFYHYLSLIQNTPIDKEKVKNELRFLNNNFEHVYLSALLKKREGNFETSFNELFTVLDGYPKHFIYYEELAYISKVSGNRTKLSDWINERKDSANNYYLYLDALVNYQQGNISKTADKLNFLVGKGFVSKEIFYQLANTFRMLGNYELASQNLDKAKKLCNDDDPYWSKIINLKGTLFFLSGEYDLARNEYESALKLSKENGNRVEEIKAIANLAIIKDQFGEVEEARNGFKKTIRMAEEIENKEILAFLYSELGVSFTYTNNLIEARENYLKSLELYRTMKSDERLSYLSSNIGSLFLQISNYKSALEYYNQGLKFAGENKLGQILNFTGLADVYSNQANYSKALQYYENAKEIADSIKDVSSVIKIQQGIGALYYNINQPAEALEILKQTDSRISSSEYPFEMIKLYSKIGTILNSIDSLNQSESYFRKGLALSLKVGDIYSSISIKTELAYNKIKQGHYNEASKLLVDAQASAKEYNLTQLLGLQELYWGKIFDFQNKNDQSLRKYLTAFQLSQSTDDYNNQIETAYLLGQEYEKESNLLEAEKWYTKAIEIIEKISFPLSLNQEIQIAHFSGVNSIYNSLAELYIQQGRSEEAFMLIDKSKSRNTKTNLDRLKLLAQLNDESEYNKLIDFEWMISSELYSEAITDSLKESVSVIKNKLISQNKMLEEVLNNNSKSLEDMQKRLNAKDYIFTVYIGEKFLTLFNLNSRGLIFKTLDIDRDSVLSMLGSVSPIYRTEMENEEIYINEDLFSYNALAAYMLYEKVFKDFISNIPKESNLIVSFPPELIKLPIEMLITDWNNRESPYIYDDKKFLLDKYQISYTPSASIYFSQMDKTEYNNNQNLLIGDPYISDAEYSLSVRSGFMDIDHSSSRNILLFPLAYSKKEIESIDNMIANNLIFVSRQATESNFKHNAPSSNIVHISTHSFLLKDQPLILFSSQGDKEDDGFLELGEIVQLNLKSELVVLSSCRSGLGKIDAAEGIIGMQKAFFEAGSKSVLVSLWDVNDKYTSYFMSDFYKYLSEGKSKSVALRHAKLDFIKNYSANPYYWSAFVLSGNPSGLKLQKASSNTVVYFLFILLFIGLVYFAIKRLLKK